MQANRPNATLAANPTKRKIVGMEPTLPTTHDPNVIPHKNERRTPPSNKRQLNLLTNKKTNYAAPALWGNSRREGVFTRRPPITFTTDTTAECTASSDQWYSNRSLAETTSNRLHEKSTPRKRTGSNIPTRSGLQMRLSKSHKPTLSANHHHQRTLCYNANRPKRKRPRRPLFVTSSITTFSPRSTQSKSTKLKKTGIPTYLSTRL